MMSGTSDLVFYVNGKRVVESNADPETTLLYYLRNNLCLTGTKLGCGEGGCGACTVMLSKYDPKSKKIRHFSANACLAPLCSMHGMAVTTVEGIGSIKNGLHPVQERIAKSHGSQCGFCTPGIVMSMYTLLRNNPQPERVDMESAFEGNLCRCTGYRPILDGFKTFTKEYCQMGEQCCRNNPQSVCNGPSSVMNGEVNGSIENGDVNNGIHTELFNPSQFLPLDSTQDPIFPPELMTDAFDRQSLVFKGERSTWHRPTTVTELLQLKSAFPDAKLVIGNTEIGVEIKLKNMKYPVMIAPTHIDELNHISIHGEGVTFGASVTLTQIEMTLKSIMEKEPEYKVRMYKAVVEILRWFAGHQIRNVAAVAGNIITASPISDLNPLFLAAGAKLTVASKDGQRTIVMDQNFFLGYRKTAVKPEEIVVSVMLPYTRENEYFGGYKQANRREDDIAIVNSGIRVLFEPNTNIVKEMTLAFGGMSITTVMTTTAMKNVIGRRWEDDLIMDMSQWLANDLPLPAGAPGGMTEYRRTLCTSFFFKFYLSVQLQLQSKLPNLVKSKVPVSYESATPTFRREASRSSQMYEEVASGQPGTDPLGRPIPHLSGAKQSSGEAIYVDDMPRFKDELYLALVVSSKAHARILSIDPSEAMKMPGVVDFICHRDVPGVNHWGSIDPNDEELFATKEVTCMGQIIGAVIADNQIHAQRAAKSVKVEYEPLEEIITIQEAIQKKSFYLEPKSITQGNLAEAFSQSDHIIEGDVSIGGQEHFYLETNATIALPKNEDGEMELFASTQNPTETQLVVAEALGVDCNKIVCRVKRMGGGFGGKETRSILISVPVAIAAAKHGVPVRCMLDRDEDMVISGTRHPFYGRYKVGFTKEGKVLALECDIYNNCGNSIDLSAAVLDRALFHCENAYHVPNLKVTGYLCKTNIPSNTAFRGFGGPQGMMICENWIEQIAATLGTSPAKIREINLYKEGDLTHFNQRLDKCNIRRCWEECIEKSQYHSRREDVDHFNKENRWKKRGISVVPVKFGISYTFTTLNQAGALVMIYRDGSVLLTHGGTEMGQGLHTKMIQVASRVLKIPTSKIHISETSTNTVPNTSATAASASSDLNGMAVMYACQTLMERLEPFINENPKGSWEDWVSKAYFERVGLSTTGFYRTPEIGYDFSTNSGRPFNYFTYGVACSEVEIDCLTGDHQVLRTDIVMDVGISLNPAIDIGQIEGAFVQGYGMMMLEQQKVSPNGFLFTRGPGNYKIPGFGDIPVEFNVSLLKGSVNNRAVYSSKAIGEPPLFLSASVFFAVKDAIASSRSHSGKSGHFRLDSPATPERIRMACEDQFTQMFPQAEPGTYKPWFVQL